MTKLVIVRHAEAYGNANSVFQGWSDSDITHRGEAQAIALADRLETITPDVIYVSPLKRTRRTVQPFLDRSGLSVEILDGLKEINGGDFEGVSFLDLPKLFPEAYEKWEHQPHLAQLPNGESMVQFQERVLDALQTIIQRHPDQTVIIITHGAVIRVWTNWLLGFDLSQIRRVPWCENTSVMHVLCENGKCRLEKIPDAHHLPEDLNVFSKSDWQKFIKTHDYINIAEWLKENPL